MLTFHNDIFVELRRLAAIVMCFLLIGCVGSSVKEDKPVIPEAPSTVPVKVKTAQEIRQQLINELLFQGLQAVDADHLSEPYSNSAVDFFGQVLDIEPANSIAVDGMRKVASRYLSMADSALANGARDVANNYLAKALRYGASQSEVDARTARQAASTKLPKNEFLLAEKDLDEKDDPIKLRLMELAVKAMRADSRLTIVARNDAEGRWIYQQMREYLVGYRLRGNIVQGQVPKVILIDMAN